MSRGPRTRTRTYVVTRIPWPSERAGKRGPSIAVEAESSELAALACARFVGKRLAPFKFDVEGRVYIIARAESSEYRRTFPPSDGYWTITSPEGETRCIEE